MESGIKFLHFETRNTSRMNDAQLEKSKGHSKYKTEMRVKEIRSQISNVLHQLSLLIKIILIVRLITTLKLFFLTQTSDRAIARWCLLKAY